MWRVFVYPTLSLFLFNWHQWDTDLLFFLTTYNNKKKGIRVLTLHYILVFDVTERARGKAYLSVWLFQLGLEEVEEGGGVCLTTRQTVMMMDAAVGAETKRWCSSNQSMERPRGCWFIGTLPFPRQNTIRRQTRCENNPISTLPDLQRPAHIWRCSKGCDWFII